MLSHMKGKGVRSDNVGDGSLFSFSVSGIIKILPVNTNTKPKNGKGAGQEITA